MEKIFSRTYIERLDPRQRLLRSSKNAGFLHSIQSNHLRKLNSKLSERVLHWTATGQRRRPRQETVENSALWLSKPAMRPAKDHVPVASWNGLKPL